MDIIYGCGLSTALSYVAYCRYYQVDSNALRMDGPFLGYDFATGSVESVSAAIFTGQCRHLDGLGNEFTRSNFPAVSEPWFPREATKIVA